MMSLFLSYLRWHYTSALRDLLEVSENFLWFFYHFFSIPVLAKTLFSPWQRLDEGYKKGFDIGAFFETFVLNALMRFFGFLIRGFVILLGLAFLACTLAVEIAVFAAWILLPLIVIVFFVSGVRLMLE